MSNKPCKAWRRRRVGIPAGGDEYQLSLPGSDYDVRVIREGDSWYYSVIDPHFSDTQGDDYPSAEKAKRAAEWYLAQIMYTEARSAQRILHKLGYIIKAGRLKKRREQPR